MTPSFEELTRQLRRLPGLGARSAERIALHLVLEKRERAASLNEALEGALAGSQACERCGNLSEGPECKICADVTRDEALLCIVESVSDLYSIEKSGSFRGYYHVLGGRLSPINGVHPEDLNFEGLRQRLEGSAVAEVLLALSADIESQATCHYIQSEILADFPEVKLTRIGFGLPSTSAIGYADAQTLQHAIDGRRAL